MSLAYVVILLTKEKGKGIPYRVERYLFGVGHSLIYEGVLKYQGEDKVLFIYNDRKYEYEDREKGG